MNTSQILAAAREHRGLSYGLAGLLFLGLFFLGEGIRGVEADVVQVGYQVSQPRTTPPGAPPSPILSGFVSGSFKIRIGSKLEGQRLKFTKVRFFDEKGKKLGDMAITTINREVQTTVESKTPGAKPQVVPNVEAVPGALYLYPLEPGTVSFSAYSTKNFGIKPQQKVYAVIVGKSGIFGFRIKCPVQPASGLGF